MAGLALVLAAVGIYGVLSYLVNQRTREIGVRWRWEPRAAEVVWLVLRQGMSDGGGGRGAGRAGRLRAHAAAGAPALSVSTLDPAAFIAAPRCWWAWRWWPPGCPRCGASRVDPMVALR